MVRRMPDKCPECHNDLYSPYTYCTSCGWKAKGKKKKFAESRASLEKEKQKAQHERERRKKEAQRRRRRELEEEEEEEEEEDEEEEEEDDEDEWDDDDWDEKPRRRGRPQRPARRERRRDVDLGYGHYSDDYRGEDSDGYDEQDYYSEDPAYDPYRKEYSPESAGGYYHGRYGGDQQRGREGQATIIPCKCGGEIEVRSTRRPLKIRCPECGRRGILQAEKGDTGRGPPSHAPRPVRGRYRDKPTSGKCSQCASYSVEFHDDGFGECLNCGHDFEWDRPKGAGKDVKKSARREQEESYSDRRGGRGRGRDEDEMYSDRGRRGRDEDEMYSDGGRRGRDEDDMYSDRGRRARPEPEEKCRYCGDALEYVPQYKRWYCHTCREYE